MICLRCRGRFGIYRGVCRPCRQAIRREIKAGRTTDAAEVAAGRMLADSQAWSRKVLKDRTHREIRR